MANNMSGKDFNSLPTKDLRGVKKGRGGFAPAETAGNQGGPGPKTRGKEANTARVLGNGREMSQSEVCDPNGDATALCNDTKEWY